MSRYFCKQKTAYGMHISDWSSDVCSSDLAGGTHEAGLRAALTKGLRAFGGLIGQHKAAQIPADDLLRSKERRVGRACVSTCSSRRPQTPSTRNGNAYSQSALNPAIRSTPRPPKRTKLCEPEAAWKS